MSYGFNALRPEKVIAFITNKGCCYNDRLPSEAALHTPGLLIAGELDTQVRRDSIRGLFNDNRPRGALWSWVEEENTGHARTDDEIVLPFMAEAIRLRYPSGELPSATVWRFLLALNEEDGWLADQSTWTSGLVDVASYDRLRRRQVNSWLVAEREHGAAVSRFCDLRQACFNSVSVVGHLARRVSQPWLAGDTERASQYVGDSRLDPGRTEASTPSVVRAVETSTASSQGVEDRRDGVERSAGHTRSRPRRRRGGPVPNHWSE